MAEPKLQTSPERMRYRPGWNIEEGDDTRTDLWQLWQPHDGHAWRAAYSLTIDDDLDVSSFAEGETAADAMEAARFVPAIAAEFLEVVGS